VLAWVWCSGFTNEDDLVLALVGEPSFMPAHNTNKGQQSISALAPPTSAGCIAHIVNKASLVGELTLRLARNTNKACLAMS
jgi:hypothetical protein